MKFFRKMGKWVVVIYAVQALVSISVWVYVSVTMTPEEIKRIISCVAY